VEAVTLTEFLEARIAEDEAVATAASISPWNHDGGHYVGAGVHGYIAEVDDLEDAAHIARHDPARVTAECDAKRQIVAALDMTPCPCQQSQRCVVHDSSAGPPEFARERYADTTTDAVLAALTLPYADHPDYRPEWKP
jgi:hypothetical protein